MIVGVNDGTISIHNCKNNFEHLVTISLSELEFDETEVTSLLYLSTTPKTSFLVIGGSTG